MIKTTRQLLIILPTLTSGGAERVVVNLSNYWAAHNKSVNILLTHSDKAESFYDLDKRVKLETIRNRSTILDWLGTFTGYLIYVFLIRHHITKNNPDALISFLPETNILVILASLGLAQQVIVCERNHIGKRKINWVWSRLRKMTYQFADSVTINNEENRPLIRRFVNNKKIVWLPNPISPPATKIDDSARLRSFLSVGSLKEQKGYDILLEAYALSRARQTGWTLIICGDGILKPALIELINYYDLQSVVQLRTSVDNVWDYYKQSKVFIMPSRYEGFPNALLEAISFGMLPIVSDRVGDLTERILDIDKRLVFRDLAASKLSDSIDYAARILDRDGAVIPDLKPLSEPYLTSNAMKCWDDLIERRDS